MKASESGFDSRSAIRNLRFRITFLALSMIAARPSEAADTLDTPLNYFLYSYGPAATPIMHLGWLMTALLSAITLIVILLLVIALFRKRNSADPGMIGAESGGAQMGLYRYRDFYLHIGRTHRLFPERAQCGCQTRRGSSSHPDCNRL